jgi:serine/threonine-protein kinase
MLAGFVKRRKWLVGNLRQCLLSRRDAPRVESLAVLPFTTNAAGKTSEYLADGITEGVINDLSQVPTLRVMARSTVFRRASDRGARQVEAKDQRSVPAAVTVVTTVVVSVDIP